MRVFPVEFIDSNWYKNKDNQIKGLTAMYEGVKGFLDNINIQIEETEEQFNKITEEFKTIRNEQIEVLCIQDEKFSVIECALEEIKESIANQNITFVDYIKAHEEVHAETHGFLDGLFKLFGK